MNDPDLARNQRILLKRVQRLLRVDRGPEDRDERSREIVPFLNSLGSVALIGGAVRDVARAGCRGFSSDLDFVVYEGDRSFFVAAMEARQATKNKFGGYGLSVFGWKVDVWHIEDTWAKTAGHVRVQELSDLLNCTFFDWDSALYDLRGSRLVLPDDYLERLRSNVMDIRLEENPNPVGSLVRALRRAAMWGVGFGPRLSDFSRRCLGMFGWDALVELDARAFRMPILRHLRLQRLLERLEAPVGSSGVTVPIPDWDWQLALPLRGLRTLHQPRGVEAR